LQWNWAGCFEKSLIAQIDEENEKCALMKCRQDLPGFQSRAGLATSFHALEGDRELCLQAGMDDYMTKPIKLDILQTLLLRWAERLHRTSEA